MKPAVRIAKWGIGGLLVGLAIVWGVVRFVPYPVERLRPADATSLRIVDRDGRPLREVPVRGGGRETWVPLAKVASPAILATIASEDHRFFEHGGLDPLGVLRAAWLNLRARRAAYGGSTISMQLVRMIEPRPRTLRSKIVETVQALRLERALGKDGVLEQYLNRAYYGNGAYGIEAAARTYFAKPAASLSLAEATLLAVLPRAPATYDPLRHLDAALRRRAHVLALLERRGILAPAERRAAEGEPFALRDARPGAGRAPHFVDWVRSRLPAGASGEVRTTLDLGLQEALEARVRDHVASLAARGVTNAGVVVLDTRTGAVRAMVGSRDFADPRGGQVNITTTPRHPGSALKPFVYALALEAGDSPATVVMDVSDADIDGVLSTRPKQHGPVRYREALASSYNIAALRVIGRVGPARLLSRLRAAGLGPLEGSAGEYGRALALGSARVRLVDLAAAYGFVARGGRAVRPRALEDERADERALFAPRVAWLVMDMLADADARRPAFGADLAVDLPWPVAVKTGTSRGFADNVAVGVTREFTAAAWAGDFSGEGLGGVLAMWGAAPLVRAGLLAAARGRALTLPPPPEGLVSKDVCRLSGARPGPTCPRKREWFVPGTEPHASCDWHRHDGVALPAIARAE